MVAIRVLRSFTGPRQRGSHIHPGHPAHTSLKSGGMQSRCTNQGFGQAERCWTSSWKVWRPRCSQDTTAHTALSAPGAARALECSKGSPHQSWGENSWAAQGIRQMLMFKALANQMSLPAPRRHSWVPPLEHPCPTRAGGGAHTEPSGSGTPWGHPKVLVTSSAEMPRESGHKSRSFPSMLAWRAALLPRNLPETQNKVYWLQTALRVMHSPPDEF